MYKTNKNETKLDNHMLNKYNRKDMPPSWNVPSKS